MFVVMSVTASEAEVIGVKSVILEEGLQPFEHQGAERLVIAVVGEVGPQRAELQDRLGGLVEPRVERLQDLSMLATTPTSHIFPRTLPDPDVLWGRRGAGERA